MLASVAELLGNCGTLVPPEDTDRFADAVRRTYQHGVGSLATQQARRQCYVQNFTPDAFGRHFAKAVAWWDARHKAS